MRSVFAWCCLVALVQGSLLADGVTRTIESTETGCQVTIAWTFSGKVESDLVIEERLASGWSVDDTTVPFASLDATWFSGRIARFAVKPALLAQAGSITFTVKPAEGAASGSVTGDWKLYQDGELLQGGIAGARTLAVLTPPPAPTSPSSPASSSGPSSPSSPSSQTAPTTPSLVAAPVSIASFNIRAGGGCELGFAGAAKAGTLVVEGCKGLDKTWTELKRVAVSAGDGTVRLEASEVGGCCFMRLKLLTEE